MARCCKSAREWRENIEKGVQERERGKKELEGWERGTEKRREREVREESERRKGKRR